MTPYDFRLFGKIDSTLLEMIIELADTGRLKLFDRWTYGFVAKDGRAGNCHFATAALLCDLVRLRKAVGWQLAYGTFMQPYHGMWNHSWLQHGDLVLNCANANRWPIYLIAQSEYYRVNNADDIQLFAPGDVYRTFTKRNKFIGTPEFKRLGGIV